MKGRGAQPTPFDTHDNSKMVGQPLHKRVLVCAREHLLCNCHSKSCQPLERKLHTSSANLKYSSCDSKHFVLLRAGESSALGRLCHGNGFTTGLDRHSTERTTTHYGISSIRCFTPSHCCMSLRSISESISSRMRLSRAVLSDERALGQCIQSCWEAAIWDIDERVGWLYPTGSVWVRDICCWNGQLHNARGSNGSWEGLA